MKITVSLKEKHMEIIEELKEKHSIFSENEIVERYIKSAMSLENDDLIFGTQREQCIGGCFSSEPQFDIKLEDEEYNKLKKVYKDYDFGDYDTEEEEISKTIRCILNFIHDEPNEISI